MLDMNPTPSDTLLKRAAFMIWRENKASTSLVQRKLSIGYNKAAKLCEALEDMQVITRANHVGKRTVTSATELAKTLDFADAVADLQGDDLANAVFAEALRGMGEFPEFQPDDTPKTTKETDADKAVRDKAYSGSGGELQQFVQRFERLAAEKQELADQQKEVMAEAKGRGYDTKVIRKIVALRKRNADDVAEEEAILDMYKGALGMA